jgi:hypothetical protein
MPDRVVLDQAEAIYRDDLPQLDLGGFADWLAAELEHGLGETDRHEVFQDALYDLGCLLEEVRFEAGLGAVYLIGLQEQLDAEPPNPVCPSRTVGIPRSVWALLTPYKRPNPAPSLLFTEPERPIAGYRLIGGWHAAQLFESRQPSLRPPLPSAGSRRSARLSQAPSGPQA